MKIKTYGIARDAAPGMRVVDDWFLNVCDLPFAKSVPIPRELRAKDDRNILDMLSKIADRFEGKDEDVKPIPPIARSVAFDRSRFPLSAFYFGNATENAARAVTRFQENIRDRAARAGAGDYLAGLRFHVGRLPEGAKVADLAPILEGNLAALSRRGVLNPPAEIRAASYATPYSLPDNPPKVGRQY